MVNTILVLKILHKPLSPSDDGNTYFSIKANTYTSATASHTQLQTENRDHSFNRFTIINITAHKY